MATRLIGTDTANPRLPAVVIAATQGTTSADLAPGDTLADAQAYTDAAVAGIVGEGGGGDLIGVTEDTDEAFRLIMFSNGSTRAVPVTAVNPAVPGDFDLVVRIGSVTLTWTAVLGADNYVIRRNFANIATVGAVTQYRDAAITVGQTYLYDIQAINGYGMRSEWTEELSAFIDPALNNAPTVTITAYPTSVALGNRAVIRVCGHDIDAQQLATTLNTSAGTLIATADPTVWHLEPTT